MDEPRVRVLASSGVVHGGGLRRGRLGDGEVLVGRLADGEVVAFSATCPHQGTDLGDARLVDGCVRCPLHAYSYDARTGENVVPRRELAVAELWKAAPGYLRVFAVEEREGWIWVGRQARAAPEGYDAAAELPPGRVDRETVPSRVVEVVRVAPGTTFELRLPTTPRPGFVWRVDTGGQLLAVVGERVEPGSPMGHVFRLAARAAGRSTVRCTYAPPWERAPAEVRLFVVETAADVAPYS